MSKNDKPRGTRGGRGGRGDRSGRGRGGRDVSDPIYRANIRLPPPRIERTFVRQMSKYHFIL